jgi:hypothetical protein
MNEEETRYDPMPLMDVLEKVGEGCEMYMNQLDNDGYCAESDEYVVALAFFADYMEKIRVEEEKEAMREGEWDRDPYDHIEERERDAMLGEDEQLADEEVFFSPSEKS